MALPGAAPKLASEQIGLGLFGLRLGLGTQRTLGCGNCSMEPLLPRKPVRILLLLLRAGKSGSCLEVAVVLKQTGKATLMCFVSPSPSCP